MPVGTVSPAPWDDLRQTYVDSEQSPHDDAWLDQTILLDPRMLRTPQHHNYGGYTYAT
jgi:hypothetical protein